LRKLRGIDRVPVRLVRGPKRHGAPADIAFDCHRINIRSGARTITSPATAQGRLSIPEELYAVPAFRDGIKSANHAVEPRPVIPFRVTPAGMAMPRLIMSRRTRIEAHEG